MHIEFYPHLSLVVVIVELHLSELETLGTKSRGFPPGRAEWFDLSANDHLATTIVVVVVTLTAHKPLG